MESTKTKKVLKQYHNNPTLREIVPALEYNLYWFIEDLVVSVTGESKISLELMDSQYLDNGNILKLDIAVDRKRYTKWVEMFRRKYSMEAINSPIESYEDICRKIADDILKEIKSYTNP